MFLSANAINVKYKSLSECTYELYEDIINFNEEYNSIKEEVILQEHSMLLEGNTLDYIQESISETASKIWQTIIKFLKGLKEKIIQVYIIVKKKVLEIIVKIKSFFTKGEEVTVIDIKEDVSKLQRLRAYASNIASVTKENIIEHKKEIAAIVGVLAVGTVAYITLKSPNSREQELGILQEQSPIVNATESILNELNSTSKNNSDDIKSKVNVLSTLAAKEKEIETRITKDALYMKVKKAFMKGARGHTISRRTSDDIEISAYEQGRSSANKYGKDKDYTDKQKDYILHKLKNDPNLIII